MCGITGFTGSKNELLLNKFLKVISHRGHDEITKVFLPGINLGMNRLAINDLRKGLYPMAYKNYLLLFNGEIYNFRELKVKLERKKIKFKTSCDAEVVLPLFDLYGKKAFSLLEGMFSLCIYDRQEKVLTLARDKFGEKPLYYFISEGDFLFSSEMKGLFLAVQKPTINTDALSQYLQQGFCFGKETLVKQIKKVQPSEVLVYHLTNQRLMTYNYWFPKTVNGYDKTDSKVLEKNLKDLLDNSVEKRLTTDVRVGCFLSGGVDSSLIAYLASKKVRNLKTFSVSFPGHKDEDESVYARTVAGIVGTSHTVVECTPKNARSVIENIVKIIDEPIVDPAIIPTFLLARAARKEVKVVLTGEGADELFGGYSHYIKELLAAYLNKRKIPIMLVSFLRGKMKINRLTKIQIPPEKRYLTHYVWNQEEAGRLYKKFKPFYSFSLANISQPVSRQLLLSALQRIDLGGYLAEQLLMKVDKATMANNLESRAPYLDSQIVEFALNLPQGHKVRFLSGKYILRKLAEKYLPHSLVWRRKHGFSVPLNDWFRGDLRDLVWESFKKLEQYKMLFNVDYFREVIDDHLANKKNNGEKIWSILVLIKWLDYYHIQID